MQIRLDPRLPLVWRDPRTLQIGVDHAVAVVEGLTARQEKIIAAIAAGHGRSGAGPIAHKAGCTVREVDDLVEALAPALLDVDAIGPSRPRVALSGSGRLADEIARLLGLAGVELIRVDADDVRVVEPPDLGVAVSRHVHDPIVAGAWLRRDVPFLCVVAGDTSTRVGPVVVPGSTACPRCLDLHRSEVDSAWGVIAGQLWGRPSAEHPLLATSEAASRAVRRVLHRMTDTDALIEMLDIDTGAITQTMSRPHPACGCAVLPRSDSVGDRSHRALALGGSTRGADVAALE